MLGKRRAGCRVAAGFTIVILGCASLVAAAGKAGAVTPPVAHEVSDGPDPVKAGGSVSFYVRWVDTAAQPVRALVCSSPFTTAGSCTDRTLATGSLSAPATSGISTATRTTVSGDVGTNLYYAFACDHLGQCSNALEGTYTVRSNNAPFLNSVFATPAEAVVGATTNFQFSFNDYENDGGKALVCKTNSVTVGAAVSCTGGEWAAAREYAPTSDSATVPRVAAAADVGLHAYYGFVCDVYRACSYAGYGTFSVRTNKDPNAVGASVTPSPVLEGTNPRMTVSWADPDKPAGDKWIISVCRTSGWTGSACSGGSWARVAASDHPHMFLLSPADAGTHSYWVWVCDASGACAGPRSGSFTVAPNNGVPVIANVTDAPNPVGTDTTQVKFTITVAWSDPDAGDVEDVFLCATNAATAAGCSSGTMAAAFDRTTSPTTLTHTVHTKELGTVGVINYWAFVCDAGGNCSPGYHGSFTEITSEPVFDPRDHPSPSEEAYRNMLR